MNTNSQMELGFENALRPQPLMQRQSRLRQARWWFERMRQVVDRALDRGPRPTARPEQIYFGLGRMT
jgi:hypothetical protein